MDYRRRHFRKGSSGVSATIVTAQALLSASSVSAHRRLITALA